MDRREPALFPEWLKGAPGSSSQSDEHSNGILSRSRLSLNASDRDASLRPSLPSFRRSVSSNGGDRDSYSHSRVYSNFGRGYRDRDRDRDRDREKARDREKDYLLDNGYHDYSDPTRNRRTEGDPLRRSHSMLAGGQTLLLPKRTGSDLSNGVGRSRGGINMGSFEREFPSLGAEEKLGVSVVGRISTPAIATAIQSLPLGMSAINGSDGWTSALAEAPGRVGGNGPQVSSGLQSSANMASVVSSAMTGLSMAAAVAQAPSRVRSAPPTSIDSERKKELKQLGKLIPVVHTNSEKSKSKGAKSSDYCAPKIGLQSSSQPANHAIRLPVTKLDMPKVSHGSNYQVLNREKNGVESSAKDELAIAIAGREATILGGGTQSVASHHLKSSDISNKTKVNGKGGERKPLSQAQDRNDFFNAIRKQDLSRNSSATNLETSCFGSSSSSSSSATNLLVKSGQIAVASGTSSQEEDIPAPSASSLECLVVVENGNNDACDVNPERLTPPVEDDPPLNEEETAFMRLLGWQENEEEALTPEEIEDFVREHPERKHPYQVNDSSSRLGTRW